MSTRLDFLKKAKNQGLSPSEAEEAADEYAVKFGFSDTPLPRDSSGIPQQRELFQEAPQTDLERKLETSQDRMARGIAQEKQDTFNNMSKANQFLAGMGKVAYMTGPGLVKRLWGSGKSVEDLNAEYEVAAAASPAAMIGELGGDIAITAMPASATAKLFSKLKTSKPLLNKAIKGAGFGVGSNVIHQGQNIAQTGAVSPKSAAAEIGISTAFPLGEKALKAMSTRVIQTALKAGKKIKGQKVMDADQVNRYFKKYSTWRGLSGAEEKMSDHKQELGQMFDALMDGLAAGTKVDFGTAIANARNRIYDLNNKSLLNATLFKGMVKQLDEFDQLTQVWVDKDGVVAGNLAQNFKKNTLDKVANYDAPIPTQPFSPKAGAKAQAARATRQELAKQLEYLNPDFKEVNMAYKKMAEIKPFIEQAVERTKANRGFSLQDIMSMGVGAGAVGGGYYMGDDGFKPGMAAAAIPFLLSRGQKSPKMAHLMHRAGQGLGGMGSAMNTMYAQPVRSGLAQSLENPYIRETVPGLAGMRLRGE